MSEENKELQENSEVVKEENKKAEETQEKSPFPEEKDYSQLSTNELVVEFKSLLDQFEVQFLKQAAEQVRKSFYDQVKVLKQAKLDEFIAQGGNEIDFSYEHPDKKAFQQLWDEFQAALVTFSASLCFRVVSISWRRRYSGSWQRHEFSHLG